MEKAKRITLNDLAKLSGVSKTTVSLILNGQAEQFRIRPETCELVKRIAKEHSYRANAYAKALQAQRSDVIGLVIPDLTNYGFASTAKTLERLCKEAGLQLVIACSDDNPTQEKQAIERLLDRQIELIITAPTHQDPHFYDDVSPYTQIVLLDRYVPELDLSFVVSDDCGKTAELVERIARTYRPSEFYYFGGLLSLSPSESRLQGFQQGLAQVGYTPDARCIFHRDYQPESGYILCEQAVQQLGRLPQAIFTASYTILEGVLRYLSQHQKMDWLVERRLHLATFDNHDILDALPFHIHSVEQNHRYIAESLFRHIKAKRANRNEPNEKAECRIIWRGE